MKRNVFSALLALCVIIGTLPGTVRAESVVANGGCGAGGNAIVWTLYDGGSLVFSGTGDMEDYSDGSPAPWSETALSDKVHSIVIEEGVTSIGAYAFARCDNIAGVVFPNSLISIGDHAFIECNNIAGVAFPNSLTSIGDSAFARCQNLESVTIPDGVAVIGDYAFSGCGMTSVEIPASVTSIGSQAFDAGLTVDGENQQYSSEDGVLFSKDKTALIAFPKEKTGEYIIPEGVTTIGDSAFARCDNIAGVVFPNSLTSIGDSAFAGCQNLENVTIPDGVAVIGVQAFSGCGMTSVEIPASVTSIGNHAFDVGLTVDGENQQYSSEDGVLFSKDKTALITFPKKKTGEYIIPEGVTTIKKRAFSPHFNPISILFPESVTTIEEMAFESCDGLTSITLPSSVTSIGKSAFDTSMNLESVVISDGLTSIEEYTFAACIRLNSITIPASVTSIGKGAFLYISGGTIYYTGNPEGWDALLAGAGEQNALLVNAEVFYHPTISWETAKISGGTVNPSVTITSDIDFREDVSTEDIGFESSGSLTLESVSLETLSRAAGGKTMTLQLAGTAQEGERLIISVLNTAFSVPVATAEGGLTDTIMPPITVGEAVDPSPVPPPAPDPDPAPDPAPPAPSDGGRDDGREPSPGPVRREVVRVDPTVRTGEQEKVVISGRGESNMQHIVKSGEYEKWIDRVNLPRYARDLYTVLCAGSDNDSLYDILIQDKYNTLIQDDGAGGGGAEVESVRTLAASLNHLYASGGDVYRESSFTGGFDVIDATAGDRAVDYASLREGDVVRTSSYNGIYVTKIVKEGNAGYDADLKEACAYASTAFQAFDRDHPEVFWLSGSTKLRLVTVTMREGGSTSKETYLFFALADSEGFTVRDPMYPNQAAIESAIQRRDQAAAEILSTVTGGTAHEKVAQLNRWLTEHNEYNTSQDLYGLPNAPHECLSALVGSTGTEGPVCDGYSRAFKVLCGKLDIPCVLVDGYAVARAGGAGEFHMWNSVQMPDGQWYGVDVTWNDPMVRGAAGARSGQEREDFLLVGGDSVVFGLKFSESHPPKNRAANGGVSFINGPALSTAAFNPLSGAAALPFVDVDGGSWYYNAVEYVFENGWMQGTGSREFSPGGPLTRAMVWTILSRMAGEDPADSEPWYAGARNWAVEEGISDGEAPGAFVTRQQLAAMLWRRAGSPASSGSLEGFSDGGTAAGYAVDALSWAVERGILNGTGGGMLLPEGGASRAQAAAMLERFGRQPGA